MNQPLESPLTHTSSATGPRRVAVRCDDVEQAESFLSKEFLPVRVSTRYPSVFDFEVMAVFCGGVSLVNATSRSGIQLDLQKSFDGYSMSLPVAGLMSIGAGMKERVSLQPKQGLIMDAREIRSVSLSSQTAWRRIGLTSDELHAHIELLTQQPMRRRVTFDPHFSMERGVANVMFEISRSIIDGLKGHAPLLAAPAALVSLKNAVLSMFVEAMPHDHSVHLQRRVAVPTPRHIRRAIDFIHANLLHPLRLADIVQASQTSARCLQLGFRQFRDTTPMEYLRSLRLDGAHHELLHCPAGTSVAEVAYRWGFHHHGMFAIRYAKAFGESPSATLRRYRKE